MSLKQIRGRTNGFNGWRPLRQVVGRNQDGSKRTIEVFRNILDGQVHRPEKGFGGEPPFPTGDLACVRHGGGTYAEGYEKIKWDREDKDHASRQ